MKTKWKPLTFYIHIGTGYCVLARINKKTGMVSFRVKLVAGLFNWCETIPRLDINEQWNALIQEAK